MPLAVWIVGGSAPLSLVQGQLSVPDWGNTLTVTGLAMSMVLNALVMSLIVFKIFKVFREVKPTSDERNLGATGGSSLRPTIFVLIESGMLLFSAQLVRLVLGSIASWTNNMNANNAYTLSVSIHEMLNVSSSQIRCFYVFYFADKLG